MIFSKECVTHLQLADAEMIGEASPGIWGYPVGLGALKAEQETILSGERGGIDFSHAKMFIAEGQNFLMESLHRRTDCGFCSTHSLLVCKKK